MKKGESTTGTTPSTSEADARQLCETIRALVRRFSVSERADVSCCGMTVAQAATLEALEIEGPLRLGDLGRRMGIHPSTLTRNLRRLEERGLVERTSESGDGRAARARLTERGRDAAREVERQSVQFARTVLDHLPEKRRAEVLCGVRELLDAVHDATQTCCQGAYDHLLQSGRGPAVTERKQR
jgi:DNA-binding MarR family transcriptional regulator